MNSKWGELYMRKKAEGHPIYRHARFYSVDDVLKMIKNAGLAVCAFSSTLFQTPSEKPYKEAVHKELKGNGGFVCILAKKTNTGELK